MIIAVVYIGKDVSEKLYAVAEYSQSLIIMTNKQSNSSAGGGTSRLSSLQVSGAGSNASAGGRAAIFNHWESELARSQSADAVHTSKQGQLRSIHWRRDQTHKVINLSLKNGFTTFFMALALSTSRLMFIDTVVNLLF